MSIDPCDHCNYIKCMVGFVCKKMLKFAFLGVYTYTPYQRVANPLRRKAKTGTKGKGAQKGQGMRMPRKEGKAQESMKGEEEKPNERGKEDSGDERKPDLWSIFKLHPLCSGLPLPHNRTRRLELNRTRPHRPPHSTHNPPRSPRPTLAPIGG